MNILISYDNKKINEFDRRILPSYFSQKVWKINFEYKTVKGKIRTDYRYIIEDKEKYVESKFFIGVEVYNDENPKYKILSPKILSIEEGGYIDFKA